MSMFTTTPKVSSPHALQRKLMIILLTSVTAVSALLGLLYNAGMRQTLMDQLGDQLKLTTERALNYSQEAGNGRIEAPGQSAGTLTARFDRLVFVGGVLDKKTKEFLALAIGVTQRCDGCIGFHVKALKDLGASRAEVSEVLAMCVYMGGGPALMYAADALRAYDQFTAAA